MSKDKTVIGKWNDVDCNKTERRFICEKRINIEPIEADDIIFQYLKNVRNIFC